MSITKSVFQSSSFQVAINLIQRLIGVVSTLILARVLTPEDFGIIAIVALTVHLIDILSDAGSQQYIIQKQDADKADLNTAWSIDILGKFLLTLIIWILAPFISENLNNPLLTDAIRIVSLSIPIRALRNPALILLAKEFQYKKLFKLSLTQKLISFSAVMLVITITPSYWAIITGDIIAAIIMFIGSYVISDYRPSWTLQKIREQWSFSQWALLRGITGFGRSQADMLIASKQFPPAALGGYHLQRELALIPAFSIVIPALEPLLSAIAKAKYDNKLLAYRIRLSMITLLAFLIPLSIFIFSESKAITSVLLGDQWVSYHQLLGFFSLMFFAFCFHALVSDCFTAINKIRSLFFFDLLSTAVIICFLAIFSNSDIFTFSLARGLIGAFITASLVFLLNKYTHFKLLQITYNMLPILLATFCSYILKGMSSISAIEESWSFFYLSFNAFVFFTSYILLLLLFIQVGSYYHKNIEGVFAESIQLKENIIKLIPTKS
jgi:O-antigen/teichoic acid export membrane protein